VQKAQERDERIREQEAVSELSARNIENDKLTRILRSRGLLLFEVVLSTVISGCLRDGHLKSPIN